MSRSLHAAAVAAAISLLAIISAHNSRAAEIRVISANGPRAVLAELAPKFESASGHKLAITVTETGEIKQRILSGGVYEVVILPATTAEELAKLGKIIADTMMPVIRTSFGMAVRAGEPKPDIGSADAFKRSLLAAKSILVTDPATGGISGVHFMSVLERLGIVEEMKPKLVLNRGTGYHAERVAKGEADLAIQAEHEIRCVPGIDFVPYPAEFQRTVGFAAGIGVTAENAPAKQFIQFLRGPEALSVIKAKCLQPG